MKEQIYTLPINEAFDQTDPCACPLCALEDRFLKEAVEYTVGAAMMEPDYRLITNEKGFCRHHYRALLAQNKALPLALVMQSQMKEQGPRFTPSLPEGKKRFLGKSGAKEAAEAIAGSIESFLGECAICYKVRHTMDKLLENTVFLWKTEGEFRKKLESRAFCLSHYGALLSHGARSLSEEDLRSFYAALSAAQAKAFAQTDEDIAGFIGLFDHRSAKQPSEQVRSALKRAVSLYSGLAEEE